MCHAEFYTHKKQNRDGESRKAELDPVVRGSSNGNICVIGDKLRGRDPWRGILKAYQRAPVRR
jgi:hypothetical protein